MVCFENRLTKNIWINSFAVFKTFEKWCSCFNFREATLIALVFKDSYKKCEIISESLYIHKRLSNQLDKLVQSQK